MVVIYQFVVKIRMIDQRRIPNSLFYAAFVTTILVWVGLAAMLIVMGAGGWFGFDNGNPITITSNSCQDNYPERKFFNQNQMLKSAFVLGLIACVSTSICLAMMVLWTVRVCRGIPPSQAYERAPKLLVYLLVNISLLCIIPIFGYFVAFEAELNECTTSYSTNSRRFLLVMDCGLLVALLVLWVMMLAILCKDGQQDPGQKYKQIIVSHPTEPHQPAQPIHRVEQTREHIYRVTPPRKEQTPHESKYQNQSQPRQPPARVYYSKQKDSYASPQNDSRLKQSVEREPANKYQPSVYTSPQHESRVKSSVLEPANKYQPSVNSRVEGSRRDPQPYRSKSKYEPSDDYDSFRNAEKNYLGRVGSRYANPLKRADDPSQGELTYHKPRQRSNRGNIFNQYEKSSNSNKEGLLLSRIRSKYQN